MTNHHRFRSIVLAGCLSLAAAITARAQDSGANATPQTIDIINNPAENAKLFSFDYGVPTSPALALAGISPDKTTTSTSLKPFVFALPGLITGSSGQSTVALDMSLALLTDPQGTPPDTLYQEDLAKRLLYRTRLGMVLYRGVEDNSDPSKSIPSHAAIGFSLSLLDSSDPVMATLDPLTAATKDATGRWNSVWDTCLDAPGDNLTAYIGEQDHKLQMIAEDQAHLTMYLDKIRGGEFTPADQDGVRAIENNITGIMGSPPVAGANDAQFSVDRLTADVNATQKYLSTESAEQIAHDQKVLAFIEGCQKTASDAAQHNADLQIGAGVVWSGDPGKWANFGNPNAAVWLAGRYPLEFGVRSAKDCGDQDPRAFGERIFHCWMVGGSGRYSAGEMVATGDTTTPEFKADVLEGWLGLERIDSNSKFGGYFGYLQQHATDPAQDQFSRGGTRWLFSAAYNLGDIGVSLLPEGMWIEGSYGSANGSVTTLDDKVAMLTLSFGPPKIGSGFVTPAAPPASPPPANGGAASPH